MASLVTAKLMKHVFMPKMEAIIDKDKKTSNRKLAAAVDNIIEEGGAKLKVLSLSESIRTDQIESLFPTVTQSGNTYVRTFCCNNFVLYCALASPEKICNSGIWSLQDTKLQFVFLSCFTLSQCS